MNHTNDIFGKGEFAKEIDLIEDIVNKITELSNPNQIILFNVKFGTATLSSFKLCIIKATNDKQKLELDIYMGINSDMPFDVIVYTPDEWEILSSDEDSFAFKIAKTGRVIYG